MTTNTQTIPQRRKAMRARTALLSLLAVLTALLFPITAVQAETYVSGHITSNTTWTMAGSPYIITGDVTVRYSGLSLGTIFATLTIEPGVEVRFEPGTGLYIGQYYCTPYHYYGALSAQGTEGSPITFTSNAASSAPGDWKGIYFPDATKDSESLLEHCIVEYGGNSHNANIYCYDSNPSIRSSTIRYSSSNGIWLRSASPTIEGNIITGNNENGIYYDANSSALISNNVFSNNVISAINVHPNCAKNISNNSGSGNGQNCIRVRRGHILASGTWKKQELPYVITDYVIVGYSGSSTATLTIEPGVVVRFNTGTRLYIGSFSYNGALSARGTEEFPITFTSNAASPAPGDWMGICFNDRTDDGASIMEHCVVEYGGSNFLTGNIFCHNAKPTIQYNTIRNSGYSGVYVYGTGSNNTVINCNNFKDNLYGICTDGNAQPLVHDNNFLRNQGYGIYSFNASGVTVDAVNNWWGDVNGPGYNGDKVYGSVTCSPWLTAESDCINTPPTNSPPFEPKNPVPANGAVRVTLTDGTVTMSWAGGDPNPWDTVVYDVYFGDASGSLALVAQDLELTTSLMSGLYVGDIYYWQVIARDNVGAETSGPVWSFTTDGPPADLTVIGIVWEPADNIEAGQTVTFTATVQNNGSAPAESAFEVDIRIDESSIGTQTVSQVLSNGQSLQVSRTWTAQAGVHTIEVVADSAGTIAESNEENNSLSQTLPEIVDPTPPELISTNPADGAALQQVAEIVITLFDQYGTVDDAAVIASFEVRDSGSQLVAGAVSESNDVFTFIPDTSPLPDDTYQVSFTAVDTAGNSQACSFSFTVNSPPFATENPDPADGAVQAPMIDDSVTLSWTGGDPNTGDTLVYDVYFGTTSGNLIKVADSISEAAYQKANLAQGTTYYWQVITRDNLGLESTGTVWQFTTWHLDLTVTQITHDPATGIEAGQEVTFTATIENNGTGPVVDAFQVNFKIDGNSIETRSVSPVIDVGGSVQVAITWSAQTGDHNIEVVADSAGNVTESDEGNNTLSMNLPNIIDPTPPELFSTNLADGAALQQVAQIVITLFDQYGTVDDAAVIASFEVRDSGSQLVAGAVSESNDIFTFIPDTSPLPDDTYHVSLTAADLAGNTQSYSFSFTVDGQPPAGPTITGGAVLSGIIQARPAENRSNSAAVTLTGTRDAVTSVWINNVEQVSTATGDWSVEITLSQGANALEIWIQDAAGNRSTSVWVDILVDSVAPAITSIAPANNSFLNTPPATVVISYQEATSGLNLTNTTKTIRDSSSSEVSGDWTVSGNDQLIFTPASPLSDSTYTVDVQLEDQFENRGSAAQYHFTVDTMLPPAPVINPVTSPAYNPTQVISGDKEAYTAILLNGQEIIGHTAATTWQHTVSLSSGQNQFIFAAKDRAGNQSQDAIVEIIYDDIPPLPVDNLTVNGQGTGTTVTLNWTGYDESVHGDIDFYRIYVEASNFSDVSGLTEHDTVSAGSFTYTAQNLTKGVTYWFAVVAVDFMGHADPSVTSVSAIPTDTVPPENVTSLTAQSFADRLVFTWDHSANSYGDLAGYHVYFGSETEPVTLPATRNTYERTGLNSASAYLFRVFAYDNDNNDSSGTAVTGYTLLPNPANLSATPYSGYVDLTWNGVSPSGYVKHYRVYVSESGFISVEGMTPSITTTSTSANVAGLTNNTTWYFAVTAVNKSDGERKEVSAISATPVPDIQGPEITDVKINGVLLTQGHTLTKPATFTLNASDPAGVSRVEFSIDGTLIRTDYNPQYSCYWDIVSVADGSYTLAITAFDTLSNSTVLEYTVNVALDPPAAPLITQPGNGLVTNKPLIAVSGSAEKNTEVILYHNGVETGNVTSVDGPGNFSFSLTLAEGENQIQAAAKNRAGTGPMSSIVLVTLDTTIPSRPANVTAQARAGGVIRLTWRAPADTAIKGYHLYRATNSFTSVSQAQRVNTNLITATGFDDLPPADGDYYYRLTTMSTADNESDLSQEVSAASDRTPPWAVSIDYSPNGNYDPQSGTMAPGTVDVVLTLSERLQSDPFLSIVPEGGAPVSVVLTKKTDVTYTGFFIISDTTPTGTAYAIFSGRDVVGNRGTEIDSGGSIKIDTNGPSVRRLDISPADPIKNDEQNPVSVTVTIGLNETVKAGTAPQLACLLSKQGRESVEITLTEITPQPEEAQTWQGIFVLPADAGLTEPETLKFIYQGIDYLDNESNNILCNNIFQVYQGDLPPLDPPGGFAGVALSGGRIRLSWNGVQEAIAYQLYRQAPGESELTAYVRIDSGLEYIDRPAVDGLYTYAVASIRFENDQEGFSSMSDAVTVNSDSVAPGAPLNLSLELAGNGIKAEWEAPPYTEEITYSLYREAVSEITSVEGLTALIHSIPQILVIDPNPSLTEHCYVVTAVDEAGNESEPSNYIYYNVGLLPVSSLNVRQTDNDFPVISWTHPGGDFDGYNLFLGPKEGGVKLNTDLIAGLSYTDTGYAGDERQYTIVAVDETGGVDSIERSLTLPVLRATLNGGAMIKRGIMNRLQYTVENFSAGTAENVCLKVNVNGKDHISESFSLQPSASSLISVVVGGYSDLEDVEDLTTTIKITPNAGEKVEIIRTSQIEVGDGMMVLQILNEEFTRGGTGKVWFTLKNTGEEEIEITTARNSGALDSNEITFYLMDQDENVLSSMAFKQALGQGIVTLSNGNTVARIPAGDTFTSEPMDMPVPANAPDNVTLQLAISDIYFHQGKTDQVKMDGLSATHDVTLIDTAYYGEITAITPESSTGDQDIIITGRAIERSTGLPMPGAPLDLVVSVNGFDRTYQVFTGDDGSFSYTFSPLTGESGIYNVRAVHPDLFDRPVHGQFTITRVSITPSAINLSIPTNYEKTINIQAATGEGTAVNNLGLIYKAADQPGGVLPDGVHLTTGSAVVYLGSKNTASLGFTIWADNTAAETGTLILKVKSDETGDEAWGKVTVNTHFSEALPVLYFSPDHVETGVAQDDTVTEKIILENRGLADMEEVAIALLKPDNTPAPNWAYLNTPGNLGKISVGDSREVSMAFSPTDTLTEGVYDFKLRVTSANYPVTDINLYVSVTQSGIGNVLFKISDIYTGTLDENNEIVQGLSGAKIKIQNEEVLTIEETITTDGIGEAYFTDLPAGKYKCRITANNHQEHIGRLWIKPGITANEEVFLNYNLVTVEWEVNEITIEDKYEIVLTAIYETDVPAAVVVAEPSSVTLPAMDAGDVYNGEFTLTNYGLIRADEISFALPDDDQHFTYELLGGLPQSIAAKTQVTVPYRITCVQSLNQDGGSGGGCERYLKCINTGYKYCCSNGIWSNGETKHCIIYDNGECTGTGGSASTGGGGVWTVGGGGGSGSVSSPAPAPKQIDGVKCFPEPSSFWKEAFFGALGWLKDTLKNIIHKVGCSVNTVTREFTDDAIDLSVKVPGGNIAVQRLYYGNEWHWEHTRGNLQFGLDSLTGEVDTIKKGGITYEKSSSNPPVYTHDTYKITPSTDGYRWEDKRGNWKEFDDSGRMSTYGARAGITGNLLYEAGEGGKFIGIADRNDNQVIWLEYNTDGLISAVYDTENRRAEYTYTNGLLTKVKDLLGYDTTYQYDTEGRITKVIDAASRETNVTYDSYGGVASVLDSLGKGHFFEFDYDEGKKESYARITTSSGMIKEIWYDRDGETKQVNINGRTVQKIVKDGRNLIVTDEKGNVTRKEYDEWDNLIRVIYPNESEVTFQYDLRFNKVSKVTDPLGNVTGYQYDEDGNLVEKVEAVGTNAERVTTYTYDDDNQLLTATIEGDAVTTTATTTFTYDSNGNITSITDPEGNTTQFLEYDNMGNLIKMKDPRDHEWSFAFDDMGRLVSQTDPLSNTTAYEYDGANNRTAVINTYLKRFEFEYDNHNNLIKAIDPYTKFITIDFNTDNLPIQITDQESKKSDVEYDNEGRITKSIDGASNQTTYHYDETQATYVSSYKPVQIDYPTYTRKLYYDRQQRVVQETDVLNETASHTWSFVYDAAGNVISTTDKQGNTTAFEYDALNRLVITTDAMGGIVERSYDDRGNLISLKDPNNSFTYYQYDRNNRLVKVTKPLLRETAYEYDTLGNRTAVLDTKGQRIEYTYNAINRLTQVRHYASGDHSTPVKTIDFTYDALGNIKTYDDGITSATYIYDDLQRKISETVDYGPFTKSYAYTYYANGVKKSFTGPDGELISYTYDENNRLTGINIPGQGQITNIYDQTHWNSPAKTMLPGGSSTDYTYDPLMQTASITAKDPGQNPVMTRSYQYSPAGNITAKNTEHGNYTYQYDNMYRLTEATNPSADDEAYTYDLLGNRLTSASVSGNWSYNANNELQGYDTISFNYDANGNTTKKTAGSQETNYIYDIEDRLIEVKDGNDVLIASYYYDPFGRRLWKDVDGTRTCFLYSDEGLVGEYDSTGAELRTYGYTPDSNWTTDPLFQKSGSIYYWYQNDHLGTPQKITSTSGAVAWAGTYDSFGNVQINSASITNNLRFGGQYYDEETGLYYNYNRYYDPTTGRYLRTDPYGEGLNLYAYCFGNPNIFIDPMGLCAAKKVWNWWSDLVTIDSFNNPLIYIDPYGLCTVNTVGQGIKSAWDWWSPQIVEGTDATIDFLFPEDNRPLGERMQAQVQWQIETCGLGKEPGKLIIFIPPTPYEQIFISAYTGVVVGTITGNKQIGLWTYWTVNTVLSLTTDRPISGPPRTGPFSMVDFINPTPAY